MKWNVGTKIGAGFGVALLILLIIGAVAYVNTSNLTQTAERVDHTQRILLKLESLLSGLKDAETGQRGYIITGDEAYLQPYQAALPLIDQEIQDLRRLTAGSPNWERRLDALESLTRQRVAKLKDGVELRKEKGFEAGRAWVASGTGKNQMDDVRKLLGEVESEESQLLKKSLEEAQRASRNTLATIVWGTLLAVVVLSVIALVTTRNIAEPLQEITSIAQRVAGGDLTVNIAASSRRDEVGLLAQAFYRMTHSLQGMAAMAGKIAAGDLRVKVDPQSEKDMLGNAFATMVQNLKELTAQIVEGVNVLGTSANQISTSTTQLAASASQTATAVTETTTTVEEVRQTAQLASQKAKSVSDTAQKTAKISQSGKKSMDDVNEGMQRIRQQMEAIADSMVRLSEQTQTIGQIIATVEDLAAQSNLLAVNASIEAAKAGEQGKGFAVVAQEVRSLADQSKQATNQVRAILSDIQKATSAAVMATEQGSKAVEAGVKQSGLAGESIQMLAGSVSEAVHAATQIAASSQQQLVGVEQVATAMESIREASTQNVASAKQLEAAAHNLNGLGGRLKHFVEQYKV